ncbi:TapY2 family type IVa secretion system protein [Shewanella sp. AC91-MNA-CIBAN-0169]|uniref:TapY2 family type IVa secretion system protein n=2 Tax=unclassified Shewanella TaxID=196818 RepID=UPI003332741A
MRTSIIFTAILYFFSTSSAFAEEEADYIPYKCHIETPNGPNIALFLWEKKLAIQEQSALLAKQVSTISNERLLVKRIVECIAEDKKFNDKFVRELDERRTDIDN